MRRVFIFANHPDGIGSDAGVPGKGSHLDVIGWETDPDQVVPRIREIQPDIVIIAVHTPQPGPSADTIRLLEEDLRVSIFELGLQDNSLRLYHPEQQLAQEVQALMDAIG